MAHLIPAGWREVGATGAALREIETLQRLAEQLPDAYSLYHGVHWTNIEQAYAVYGEIDFIILAPDGKLLLIEQKSGFLSETPEGLIKKYQHQEQHIHSHLLRAVQGLRSRFAGTDSALSIEYLLYCPDYLVKNPLTAGIPAERMVDASRADSLAAVVQSLLPLSALTPQHKKVSHFLGDMLSLTPDPSAMIGRADQLVTRLSGGLASWARQLEFSPFRLRVCGTAGSGKTQLALAEYRAAVDAGLKPLYVCYNRPLADHVQSLLPAGGRVASFHALCDSFAREHGVTPDYAQASMWSDLETFFVQSQIPKNWQCDVLIVDEGQDFSESWRDIVLRLLKPEGRAIWLEDPLQNLYAKAPVKLDGWVSLHSYANFRSPRQIIDLLTALEPHGRPVQAASPFLGADIVVLTYPHTDTARLQYQTKHAITLCLGAGFTRADMALVSFRGRENSALLQLDRLGSHSLHSFTGQYDLFGVPQFRPGELLAESVYRFKGQSAPALIFTEIDFAEFDERAFKKLFVGMTRARLKLVLVMSERTHRCLEEKIGPMVNVG